MKRFLLILVTLFFSGAAVAEHITGGEMYYTYIGVNGSGHPQYRITLKLFRDCLSAGAPLDESAAIAIFIKGTNQMHSTHNVSRTRSEELKLGTPGACITNAPFVCYDVGYYEFTVALPMHPNGYTISYQRCCRISGINNLVRSSDLGATYTAEIPGTNSWPDAPINHSARFVGTDTVIICAGYPFTYSFAASDSNSTDVLRYSFCNAYRGGGQDQAPQNGPNTPIPNPPAAPPYNAVSYSFPYNGSMPLGVDVSIDPATGLISGTAPPEGIYVVTVCVEEIRDGKVIATQRKDLQIKAGGCDIAKANLAPEYITCDGFTLTFSNAANSPLINSYYWEFGDPGSGAANNFSIAATPTHTYSVAGEYTIKLVTNRNQECSDSATALVKVWPGFFPDFSSTGVCLINPVNFVDQTTTNYGVVDQWQWDFGQLNANNDTANIRHPQWNYADTGTKNVRLIVGNSKGCVDTITKTIKIIDKPPITLAFRDTLICVPDNLQLQASGTGNFSWSPNIDITGANTATPTVSPTSTTRYTVHLNDQGCANSDSVNVRVVPFVTIDPFPDTTICLTDSVQINLVSDGLNYQWTSNPPSGIDDTTLQNPTVLPDAQTTIYHVVANIGTCSAEQYIVIKTDPYPTVNAGADTTICYNTPAFLLATHDGSSFHWTPVGTLANSNTLNPTAFPLTTTTYVLAVYDTLNMPGCPKPAYDTVVVNVMPRIVPFAGRDTMVVVGQPLQFNASGGVSYHWSPATYLSDPQISDPVAVYGPEINSIRYKVEVFNEIGCSDTAYVKVKVFKTNPYVFVPSAFTPNGDGLNDIIRPIAVGVQEIKYFRIYNRWGQMIFHTTTNEQGWDGRLKGTLQGTNVFVWMVSAIDYLGKPIFLKGTFTLIR